MRLDYAAFENLFTDKFDGNYHEAARQLGADVAQIHRIVKTKQGAGLLFLERLIAWCDENNVDCKTLLVMPKALRIVNAP